MKCSVTRAYRTRSIDRAVTIVLCGALAASTLQPTIGAHEAYLMSSNHSDYN